MYFITSNITQFLHPLHPGHAGNSEYRPIKTLPKHRSPRIPAKSETCSTLPSLSSFRGPGARGGINASVSHAPIRETAINHTPIRETTLANHAPVRETAIGSAYPYTGYVGQGSPLLNNAYVNIKPGGAGKSPATGRQVTFSSSAPQTTEVPPTYQNVFATVNGDTYASINRTERTSPPGNYSATVTNLNDKMMY